MTAETKTDVVPKKKSKKKWIVWTIVILVGIGIIGSYNATPTIYIDDDESGKISTDKVDYELIGYVSSSKATTLTIDGKDVPLEDDSNKFSYKTSLKEGDNTFNLVATNDNGEAKETVTVRLLTKEEQEALAREEAEKKAEEERQEKEKGLTKEQKKAQEEAAAKEIAEMAKKHIIDQFAPQYCEKKQTTKVVLNDSGKSDGWPPNDGSGWTQGECKTIISKLYDLGVAEKEFEVIIKGNYAIGMQEMSLLYSLGSPRDINRTHVAGGTSAQYVYGDPIYSPLYIYTSNGVVTSVQN